jgi:hypothetical protein
MYQLLIQLGLMTSVGQNLTPTERLCLHSNYIPAGLGSGYFGGRFICLEANALAQQDDNCQFQQNDFLALLKTFCILVLSSNTFGCL